MILVKNIKYIFVFKINEWALTISSRKQFQINNLQINFLEPALLN